MNKTMGLDNLLHTMKLKLYGWMTKKAIRLGDDTGLEKTLNEYTNLKAQMYRYTSALVSLNQPYRLATDIAKSLQEVGIKTPRPKFNKFDNEINQLTEAEVKLDEVLDLINQEIKRRGLKTNRVAEGRLYLVKDEVSSKG